MTTAIVTRKLVPRQVLCYEKKYYGSFLLFPRLRTPFGKYKIRSRLFSLLENNFIALIGYAQVAGDTPMHNILGSTNSA